MCKYARVYKSSQTYLQALVGLSQLLGVLESILQTGEGEGEGDGGGGGEELGKGGKAQ